MASLPPFVPLDHWRRRTQQIIEGLLERIDDLSVSDYPAPAPIQVIEFLQDFLRVLSGEVDKAGSENKLRLLSSLVQDLGIFLEWLDNAHTGQTPRGLVQVLKDLMDRMVPNFRVVARPQPEYNYSIIDLGLLLKKLVDQFVPLSKQTAFQRYLGSPVKLISFPRIERDNLLAHAIFGHELGHPIADEFLSEEAKDPDHKADQTRIQQLITDFLDHHSATASLDAGEKLQRKTKIFKTVLEVRKRALEELISDAVGILIFGPSALFSMFELLWSGNWDAKPAPDDWYPPSRMRMRLMLKLLEDLGWAQAFSTLAQGSISPPYIATAQGFIDEAKNLVLVTSDESAIDRDQILKIAYDWMRSGLV